MRVTTNKIQGHTVLRYRYRAGGCMDFDLYLLSEVGEPYQPEARAQAQAIADRHCCDIVQVELLERPYYVDALVRRTPK